MKLLCKIVLILFIVSLNFEYELKYILCARNEKIMFCAGFTICLDEKRRGFEKVKICYKLRPGFTPIVCKLFQF